MGKEFGSPAITKIFNVEATPTTPIKAIKGFKNTKTAGLVGEAVKERVEKGQATFKKPIVKHPISPGGPGKGAS